MVGGVALIISGAVVDVLAIVWAGGACLVAAAVSMLVLGLWFVAVEPAADPEFLVIRRVHRGFAAALGG